MVVRELFVFLEVDGDLWIADAQHLHAFLVDGVAMRSSVDDAGVENAGDE